MSVPDWFGQLLNRELDPWLRFSEFQIAQLYQHYQLLLRWNQRMNLTTVKPGPETVIRHYCESSFFAVHIPASPITVLDLGSGAGFPGVPIAVLRPASKVILVESVQKKAAFLRESTRHLQNVSVRAARIEDVSQGGDWVVSRAVDPQEVLAAIPRLASNIGLMLGEDDFLAIRDHSGIAWKEAIRLPWGDRKICVYGECST